MPLSESHSPPLRFRGVSGGIASARIAREAPNFRKNATPPRGAKVKGLRYERKAQAYLEELFGERFVAGPWIHFREEGAEAFRWCQPDGLVIDLEAGTILCVEIKYNHTADAWWQLRHLYGPLLKRLFPERLWRHEVCEVVKWYDPLVVLPEASVLVASPDRGSDGFKVHIFND